MIDTAFNIKNILKGKRNSDLISDAFKKGASHFKTCEN